MATSASEIAAAIEANVRVECGVPDNDPLFTRATDLFECGYVDSVAIVAFVVWLEGNYHVELSEDELFDERFTTIDGIASIIADSINDAAP